MFDEADVIARCAAAFRSTGYEGTSIDELVQATGLHRGSLYKAFGSKRGLFVLALRQTSRPAPGNPSPEAIDLLLVALMELAPRDPEIRALAFEIFDDSRHDLTPRRLGERLLERARESTNALPPASPTQTTSHTQTKEPA